ncbi:hypothetical protein MB84_29430 (plasmid) [Pandoraea oxalativorans]|uniref:Uncharacterized protein n=1 Tax=Pandoraea oxalativorans TaxID=573737 RepID=A0A0G3IEB0_9BURK|nr:hypothetical protein MB84_29430 [Pandoraea oxalativorans]
MYSYEARVRADALWLKHGKRIKATLRPLGDPTKHALKAGGDELEKRGDWGQAYVRAKPKYAEDRKHVALEPYVNHGRRFAVTLRV